jgi:hypothetical protein
MSGEEALAYGIIDQVVTRRPLPGLDEGSGGKRS